MLSNHDPDVPLFFECNENQTKDYDGIKYIFSHKALPKFIKGIRNSSSCWQEIEDDNNVKINECLENYGLHKINVTNLPSRIRYPVPPYKNQYNNYNDLWSDVFNSFTIGTPRTMRIFNFLIYGLRPYGTTHKFNKQKVCSYIYFISCLDVDNYNIL